MLYLSLLKWDYIKKRKIVIYIVRWEVSVKIISIENLKILISKLYDKFKLKIYIFQYYFNYKISYYKTSPTSIYFPEMREQIIPIYMTEEQEEQYNIIKQ